MHRIDTSTATPDHKFTEGNPAVPVAATTVSAAWLNAVQEELVAVITGAGLELKKSDNGQLRQAIGQLITSARPGLATKAKPGLVQVGGGLDVTAKGLLSVLTATLAQNGIMRPDGTTCTVENGVLKILKQTSDYMEEWRKSWIGVPRYWRSTILPANHCWANGDAVLFADWPELKAVYDAGGFEGARFVRNSLNIDVLVPDRRAFARAFPHVALDRADIESYMSLTLKGEPIESACGSTLH